MKNLTLAILVGVGFFISAGTAFADTLWDGSIAPNSVMTNGTTGGFGSYEIDIDNLGTLVQCASGSSWVDGANVSDLVYFSNYTSPSGRPVCYAQTQASTTAVYRVAGNGQYIYISGTLGGSDWANQGGATTNRTQPVSIDSPSLYATTTSPVVIQFTYYVGTETDWINVGDNSTPTLSGYVISLHSSLTSATKVVYGLLPSTSWGLHTASTSVDLPTTGTWYATVGLNNWTSGQPIASYRSTTPSGTAFTYFGINFNDAIQTVSTGTTTCSTGTTTVSCNIVSGSFNLGDCVAELLVPSACDFNSYASIPGILATKMPFQYGYSIAQTWQSLVASTTANAPTYTYGLHDLGIGSTTGIGNILPNVVVFSASTTKQYFPSGTFDLLKLMAGFAIILETMWFAWNKLHNLIRV